MKTLSHLLIFGFFATLFTACHKDGDSGDNVEIINEFSAVVYEEINGTIVGTVLDENGNPISDAIVQIYSAETKTNEKGVFLFKNTKMDRQGTYIRVQKPGYVLSGDFVSPDTKGYSTSTVRMYSLDKSKLLDAGLGGKISAKEGASVVFEPRSILTQEGTEYKGTVYVTAEYLNPKDKQIFDKMPGGLLAEDTKGNTVILGTLGMIAVELRDGDGNELKLDPTKPAEINIPVNTEYSPATIPLWSFDERKGWWKEEGIATRNDNYYTGKVSHFSFWNCDAPFPLVQMKGRVIDNEGNPLSLWVYVSAESLNTAGGLSNSEGYFGGKVPKGKVLTITVRDNECADVIKTVTVGPFDNDFILDDIVVQIDPLERYKVSGIISCDGIPITDGVAMLKINGFTLPVVADEAGKFEFDYTMFTCVDPLVVSISAFDNESGKTSPSTTVIEKIVENLTIDVCSAPVCEFTPTLTITCDSAVVSIIGGSGNFTYQWGNGAGVGPSALHLSELDSVAQIGTPICVTITDVNVSNCSSTLCKQSQGYLQVFGEKDCGDEGASNGTIFANAWNGSQTSTYTYLWSNGSTGRQITNLSVGNYCVTVTANNGCTASKCFDIFPMSVSGVNSCSNNIYTLESTPFENGQLYGQGIAINTTFPINVDVTLFGYNANGFISSGLNGTSGGEGCFSQFSVALPQIANPVDFKITSEVKPTCGSCNDGKITYTLNNAGACIDCQIGEIKLYNRNNLTSDLITSINALDTGKYFLVLTDVNTGCWIAHRNVSL